MKKLIFTLIFALFTTFTFAQKDKSDTKEIKKDTYQLSSHILDVSKGMPASGVTIKLEMLNQETKIWSFIEEKITDKNGRISDFLHSENSNIGIYRLTYHVKEYFEKDKIESFYPFIEVVFEIKDDAHYHVPITLSAFGYSTYRGN